MNLMDELKVANSTIDMLREEITRLQGESERWKKIADVDSGKYYLMAENERFQDQLRTAEQRVARECCEIADKTSYTKIAIREIKAKYGL